MRKPRLIGEVKAYPGQMELVGSWGHPSPKLSYGFWKLREPG